MSENKRVSNTLIEWATGNIGIIVALFSALSAFIALLFYVALYVSDASILAYWDIPLELIDISDNAKIYKLGIITFSVIIFGVLSVYTALFVRSRRFFAKHFAALKISIKNEVNGSNNSELVNKLKNDYKSLKNHAIKEIVFKLIIPIILIFIIYVAINSYSIEPLGAIIWLVFLFPISSIVLLLNEWIYVYKISKEQFKDAKQISERDLCIQECLDYKLITFDQLSVDIITIIGGLLISLIVIMFLATCFEGRYDSEKQSSFPIVSSDNNIQAVMYLTKNYAVLEDASIKNDTLIINTSKQVIVDVTTLEYRIMTFEKVTKE